jgi:hypothetical protein
MGELIDTFRPLLDAARGVALEDPTSARRVLTARFDPASAEAKQLNQRLIEHLNKGEIANRGALPVKFGRVTKASPETHDFSIDVVHMNGAGPLHRHPAGEINYCIALDGHPTFMGQPAGWVVELPGSQHVPTVAGGTMLIVYLLPQGRIEFVS